MDSIEYEEFSLKGIHAPETTTVSDEIDLLHPTSMQPSAVLPYVTEMTQRKAPYHRRYFYQSLAILPFTLPIALIPIIPNIPGFYCAFRAWSHWKAGQGVSILEALNSEGRLVPTSSSALDILYDNKSTTTRQDGLLLDMDKLPEVCKALEADTELAILAKRAAKQLRKENASTKS